MTPNYLTVPVQEQDRALALGAKLDSAGALFVPQGLSLVPFQAWLPSANTVGGSDLMVPTRGISLSALLARCGAVIKSAFPEAVWVRIEISQIKSNGGHLYIGAVERTEDGSKEVAKTTAMIWSSQVSKLVRKFSSATGMELAAGIQILVLVQPDFRPQYGLSLQIIDIDPTYTLGDLEAQLKRIREALAASGEAALNRKLPTPDDFFHVGVISPAGAAGLEDFQAEANVLTSLGLCEFTYFEAIFQGEKTKESVKQAMIDAHNCHESKPFSALAIIRGGGAAADLHWLNEYVLARLVCRFRCPIFTGIGHERDKSILDEYANRAFGTPSKVIAHIKESIIKKALKAEDAWTFIKQTSASRLESADTKADLVKTEMVGLIEKGLDRAEFGADKRFEAIKTGSSAILQAADAKVDLANQTISTSARNLLKTAETGVENNFSTLSTAAQHKLDMASKNAERHMADIRFYVGKTLDDATTSTRDLITGILAYGVQPTLQRGFAYVRNARGPISTKASAEQSDGMEIVFRDGTLKITKGA